jgi:hypothetical protein
VEFENNSEMDRNRRAKLKKKYIEGTTDPEKKIEIKVISKNRSASNKIKFMLRDVIYLRQGKLIPRRNYSSLQIINQIQKEAESGTLGQHLLLNSSPLMSNPQDRRVQFIGGKGRNVGMSDDEWITMGPWARLVGHPCKQGTPQN